jgi:chaperonin cofactor prefoldin
MHLPAFLFFKPKSKQVLPALLFALTLLTTGQTAAQQTSCARIARDMQGLQDENQTNRADVLRKQAQRNATQAYKLAQQIETAGCNKSGFLFFGNDAPPQCADMKARVEQLTQRSQALLAQAERAPSAETRLKQLAKLEAAYENRGCNGQSQAGIGETPLPPVAGAAAPQVDDNRPSPPIGQPTEEDRAAAYASGSGAPGAVCVRLCDGYFFPLSGARSRSEAGEMCQAQCPATETALFYRRGGAIASAFSPEGQNYSSLPNAFAYQKSFNPDCSCKQAGESWASALQTAESMVSQRGKPDLIVDEKTAASWPSVQAGLLGKKGAKGKTPKPEKSEEQQESPEQEAAALSPAAPTPEAPAAEDSATLRDETMLEQAPDNTAQAEAVPQDDASTAGIADDNLGDVIQQLDGDIEAQPIPPPIDGDRDTVIQLLDDLPPPEEDGTN